MPAPDDTAAPWTPGPWSLRPNRHDNHDVVGGDNQTWTVAETYGYPIDGRELANAHLIAAAPSLAETLNAAPILSKYHGQRGFETERFIADYEAWRVDCRAALALARGETP